MNRVVTEDMNNILTKKFNAMEVNEAAFQIKPLSSLGLDFFPLAFDQTPWDYVGKEVIEVVLYALNSAGLVTDINDTFLALIPKLKSPIKVSDFRPISFCNVLYKIISKTIANRLKRILPDIIFPT